ncbi:MAG TPA: transporter substrate-binding domain-containing protein [Candidatus Acidoferrum sp.]|nr:transporter substrate-binding domain-containing protein [Candidatus Acidoferrum sp.]
MSTSIYVVQRISGLGLAALARWMTGTLAILAVVGVALPPARVQADETQAPDVRQLVGDFGAWSGDFDGMLERRLVRVAVPYGRTLFYHDRGRERGLTADSVRKFEEFLNTKYKRDLKRRPITVVLIPTTRDQLIPALLDGRADIAAGNITITEARQAKVDFSVPIAKPFSEIIVTGPGAPTLNTLDDLAGQEVFVRPATSYYASLIALNDRFQAAGKPPMILTLLPDPIEDEDKLDMINAGLLQISVIDEWLADVWAPILPQLAARKDLVLRTGGEVAWAFRKGSPKLQAEVDDFITNVVRKYGLVATNLKSFSANLRKAENAKSSKDWQRFQQVVDLFRKYGDQYRFDHLLLAAQGYQESQLDQSKRSKVGAIGIMQLMPATGQAMKVGDVAQAEPNVHAGAKYMDQIMETYFGDAELSDENRTLFAFAAYNAGPARVAKLRKLAAEQGYDPNKWFNNVEWVVADKVGQEPVTYVRNIYKYYVSYKLAIETERAKREAAGKVQQAEPAQ